MNDTGGSSPRGPDEAGADLPVEWHVEGLPSGDLRVLRPAEPDALLDRLTEAEFAATDERMPYFALVWPSARVLAEAVLAGPSLGGARVLDLGAGVGLVGLAALARGAPEVVFLDWEPRGLALARRSVEAAGAASRARYLACDWRAPPAALGRFDLVLAADVLYEERNATPVAAFLSGALAEGGEAWVADPGRRHAESFPERLREAGLALVERSTETLPDGTGATRFRIRLAAR